MVRRSRKRPPKFSQFTCARCGGSFTSRFKQAKYCGARCRTAHWQEYRHRYWLRHKGELTFYHAAYHTAHRTARRRARRARYYARKQERGE